MPGRGELEKISASLALVDGLAHVAFFGIFGWRTLTSPGFGRLIAGALASLALLGLALSFLGGLLVKHGGRTPAGRVGRWAVAGSTALATVLLLCAG
jgi:hypothetical protein